MDALFKVLDIEKQREESALQSLQLAQRHWNEQKQKLASLQNYRIEYINKIQTTSENGLAIKAYQQVLSFIAKLDTACEQQSALVAKASLVCDQRRQQWVNQQKKRKAIEVVLQQRAASALLRHQRAEQREQDEWVSQRIFRLRSTR